MKKLKSSTLILAFFICSALTLATALGNDQKQYEGVWIGKFHSPALGCSFNYPITLSVTTGKVKGGIHGKIGPNGKSKLRLNTPRPGYITAVFSKDKMTGTWKNSRCSGDLTLEKTDES